MLRGGTPLTWSANLVMGTQKMRADELVRSLGRGCDCVEHYEFLEPTRPGGAHDDPAYTAAAA